MRPVFRHFHRDRYRRKPVTHASPPGFPEIRSRLHRLDTGWPLAAGFGVDRITYRELSARCDAPGWWAGARLGSHEAPLPAT